MVLDEPDVILEELAERAGRRNYRGDDGRGMGRDISVCEFSSAPASTSWRRAAAVEACLPADALTLDVELTDRLVGKPPPAPTTPIRPEF
jgi:hypothetical protein